MTANHLERFARAHRQVSSVDDQAARLRRRLAFRLEDDGSLSGTFHLPPLAGAALLKALRAVLTDDQQDPHPAPDSQPDPPGVSAETPIPPANPLVPGHPADSARCHVENGPAISAATAQRIACSATWTWMLHDSAGKLLDLGRRRRRPSSALRRAARDRDSGRCRFPGCESRRVDLHHIQYWSNGGQTKLDNLISLCRHHHQVVHDRGYLIALTSNGTFAFYDADGSIVPSSPPLPDAPGSIEGDHDAGITPETIIPAWYGERLDLDHALYVCFANAALAAKTQAAAEAEANHEAATLPAGESPLKAGPPRSPERPIIATPADVRLLSQPFAWTSVPPRWTSG